MSYGQLQIIGHRGAKGLAPENTLASIKKGLDSEVDMIEIDVRTTKDKVAILCHDPVIADTKIETADYKFLVTHKPDIATLKEAFRIIPRSIPINVECKPGTNVEIIQEIIQDEIKQGRSAELLLLSSFDHKLLKCLHALLPDVPVAILERRYGIRAVFHAHQLHTKRLHFSAKVIYGSFISLMTRCGWHVYSYTVNDPDKARRWQESGLKGIFTDYPDRFMSSKYDRNA